MAKADGPIDESKAWYNNTRTVLVLLLILVSALSMPYFRKFQEILPKHHPAMLALLSGFIVSMLTYPLMRFADPKFALSNAVLLGLLVAEFVVYGAPYDFPAPIAISFFFFMYLYGRAESEHLWPETYEGVL